MGTASLITRLPVIRGVKVIPRDLTAGQFYNFARVFRIWPAALDDLGCRLVRYPELPSKDRGSPPDLLDPPFNLHVSPLARKKYNQQLHESRIILKLSGV
jgi:hypothetical protein